MTAATAELVEDGGAAASSAEYFRSQPFLQAERVTHTLRVKGPEGEVGLPVIVREIPGTGLIDAASPYGYPGGDGAHGMDPAAVDWRGTGLVSLFVRDRIGSATCLAGGTLRTQVQVADPALPRKSRMSDRQQIRRNLRDGWRVDTVQGPEVTPEQRGAFERAYNQTMERTSAAERYFFGGEYFEAATGSDRLWLLLAVAPDGRAGAGALATLSDGFLHYYLSGTGDESLTASPMKNLIESMIELAERLEVPLNLGGGAAPGDSLEAFKRGFANREEPFHTHEVVCDPEAYAELSSGRPDGGFFPAYRAP